MIDSLQERLDATKTAENPFEELHAVAKSLKEFGFSQVEIYHIFEKLYLRHQHDEDETFYDLTADVLDCIWSGGWAKGRALFKTELTSQKVSKISIDVSESSSDADQWEMEISHPHIYLRFRVGGTNIASEFLAFLRRNLNQRVFEELELGTLGHARLSIIKDDEFPNRFFLCVLSDGGAVRYTLNVDELGSYIGALMRTVGDLSA